MTEIIEWLQSYFRWDLFGILNILSGILNISIGTLVFMKDKKSLVNRSFFLITIAAFIWVFSMGMVSLVESKDKAEIWMKACYFFGVPFISPTVYLFSSIWLKIKNDIHYRIISFLGAAILSLFWILNNGPIWMLSDHSWGRYVHYGIKPSSLTYVACLVTFFWFFAFKAFYNFYKGWKIQRDPNTKIQFRNILIGFLLAYTGGIDFIAAYTGKIFPFGFLSLLFLTTIIGYTIIKHQFLDVKIALKKVSLVVTIYISLVGISTLIGFPFLKKFIDGQYSLFLFSSCIFGLILSTGPLIYAFVVKNTFWLKDNATKGLAHELKSPLSSIEGSVDFLLDQIDSVPKEKIFEYLNLIKRNNKRLNKLTHDLLNLAKISTEDIRLELEKVNLVSLINEEIKSYKPQIDRKKLQIEFETCEEVVILADAEKLRQVISNLLSNAAKFTESGKIMLRLRQGKDKVEFSISDTGRGLPKGDEKRIFDRFYQSKKTSKGSGLGLSIAKSWIEAHSGKIWAESSISGITVYFVLPKPQ